MNSPLLVFYATAIFSVITLGGLVALRGLRNVLLRALVFLALCYAALRVTFWLSGRWSLNPVELGIAWAVAFVVVGVVEAAIRVRRSRRMPA